MCRNFYNRMEELFTPILIINLLLLISSINCSKYNISITDLFACEEFRLQSDYGYKTFYEVKDLKSKNCENSHNEAKLCLKFYVMAIKDAHILLADKDDVTMKDRVYEIVIGAGANAYSTLRGRMGTQRLAGNVVKNVLSPVDPTPIEIYQYSDGTLDVKIPGNQNFSLIYTDKNPLNIKFLSFGTFASSPARWFYDCKMDNESNTIKKEERNMTHRDRLETVLMAKFSYWIPPLNLKIIKFSFLVSGVSYDEDQSILQTRIAFKLFWNDERYKWNPKDYGNLEALHSSDFYYWLPSLMLFNGAKKSFQYFSPSFSGSVFYNGTIIIQTPQEIINTWCLESTKDWPNDDVNCTILLGLLGNELSLVHDVTTPFSEDGQKISQLSQWRLGKISIHQEEPKTATGNFTRNQDKIGIDEEKEMINNEMMDLVKSTKQDVRINFILTRNKLFYNNVFYTPLIVSCVVIFLSFFMEGYMRGAINLFAILICSFSFLFLSKYAPVTYVPRLIHVYQVVLFSSCYAYILHIQSLWLTGYPPLSDPPSWVMAVTSFSPLRIVLGMNLMGTSDYLRVQKYPWNEVSNFINRISALLIAILYGWLLIFIVS